MPPTPQILCWGYQHVSILEPTQTLASGVICVTPDINPRRQSVEYRWRWAFWRWGWRWPCTFHVFCVDFICVLKPTQTQFPVEYGSQVSQCRGGSWEGVLGVISPTPPTYQLNVESFISLYVNVTTTTGRIIPSFVVALTCTDLPMILNATTEPTSGTNLAYNTSVTVTCDSGLGISNEVNNYTSLCNEDSTTHTGVWTNLMNCSGGLAYFVKPILHYALGLRFGNLKRSKTEVKTQLAHVFTKCIV